LPQIAPQSIHCCVTSPPYWKLRSYLPEHEAAKSREIGSEPTVEAYVRTLVGVFRQVARVLLNEGTLWLNLGDRYTDHRSAAAAGTKPGDLIGLPWRVALALQADGWYLRSDIIWDKPNPKPESVTDRPTKAHEYLFLLSKQRRYYYDIDALREAITSSGGASFGKQRHATAGTGAQSRKLQSAAEQRNHPLGKNKRSVWRIPVRSFPGAHFAVFPEGLVRPAIMAGSPKGGTVLDPFAGSGTTGHVAEELGRNAILMELNPLFVEMQRQRGPSKT
jgi:DNA modification methylase